MMKKNVKILGAAAVLIMAGLIFFANRLTPQKETIKTQASTKPWVEVLKPLAVVTKFDGSTSSLQTGDEVEAGDVVKTDKNGLANIYFPDGSVIRIDLETELKIVEAAYDLQNQKLTVKLFVNLGRVWSKIIKLSTPDSVWEVNTSNAVATVRGTAFGVEFMQGKTTIIGSENNVAVRVRDPITKNLSKKEVIVSPNKFLQISEAAATGLVTRNAPLDNLVLSAPSSVLNRTWIKRAKARDLELDKTLNLFGTSTLSTAATPPAVDTSVSVIVSTTNNILVEPPISDTSNTTITLTTSPNLNPLIR